LDYIFCISLNQLGTWYRSPVLSRITRIYNCIDTDVIDRIPLAAGREKKIMFIGAPRESKGFHDALRVFDAFARRNPGYVLYVAGAADLHGSAGELSDNGIFEKAYEERHLGGLLNGPDGRPRKDVVLLGKLSREQVLWHLGSSRVALQNPSWTSQPEVHSVSALEAQAMGVPVVSTFRGGQPEVVEDGKTGILAKRKGDGCLVAALERIVRDELLSGMMSADARKLVRTRFNAPAIAGEWDRAIRAVAAGERFHGNLFRALRSKIRHKLHL
jgi:glycosyltransferase involved in cell wall biosynthesis